MIDNEIIIEDKILEAAEQRIRDRRRDLFLRAKDCGATWIELHKLNAIETIKAYRNEFGVSLMEARNAIQAMCEPAVTSDSAVTDTPVTGGSE